MTRFVMLCLAMVLAAAFPAAAQTARELDALAPKVMTLAKFAEGIALQEDLEDSPQYLVMQRLQERDPSLLVGFEDYYVEADVRGGHGVVLVCSAGAKAALFEDVGCKTAIERDVRAQPNPNWCTYMLNTRAVCGR